MDKDVEKFLQEADEECGELFRRIADAAPNYTPEEIRHANLAENSHG